MIQYRLKAFFNDEKQKWGELEYYDLAKCIFDFNAFDYKVNNKIFKKDNKKFREAIEQVQMWNKLIKKRSPLDVLKDFEKVAVEIENAKKNGKY